MRENLLSLFGGGGNVPQCNTDGVCFLGKYNNIVSYSDLSAHFGVTEGNINSTSNANKWLHFTIDDKELLVSKVAVRYNIGYSQLYSKGLVYGTNNDGVMVPPDPYTGGPVNQLKTITLNGSTYKCRLLKGSDTDPFPTRTVGNDIVGSQQSEWSRLFYPIVIDDPNISSYTGPMLASYTEADLQMRQVSVTASPGSYNWCQEIHPEPIWGTNVARVIRSFSGPSLLSRVTLFNVNNNYGWRACLEKI